MNFICLSEDLLKQTGIRQYTQAVWSTFAKIHSTHPASLMGLLEFPVRICDVLHTTTLETYLIYPMIAISSYHCMPLCLHVRLRNALPTS